MTYPAEARPQTHPAHSLLPPRGDHAIIRIRCLALTLFSIHVAAPAIPIGTGNRILNRGTGLLQPDCLTLTRSVWG